ncbi:MAG: hypothetical protein ACLQFR_08680 [Streptosporangiaceae bacterium]
MARSAGDMIMRHGRLRDQSARSVARAEQILLFGALGMLLVSAGVGNSAGVGAAGGSGPARWSLTFTPGRSAG